MKRFMFLFLALIAISLFCLTGVGRAEVVVGQGKFSDIAINSSGNGVVVWIDTTSKVLYFKLFDTTGVKPDYHSIPVINLAYNAHVAISATGKFVITWSDSSNVAGWTFNVYCQTFDANGDSLTARVKLNDYTGQISFTPAIDMDYQGNAVLAWAAYFKNSDYLQMWAQRLDSLGHKLGSNLPVSQDSIWGMSDPEETMYDVDCDSSGNFAVVWQDEQHYKVFDRFFQADGNPQGNTFTLNSYSFPFAPRIAFEHHRLWVIWYDLYEGYGYRIFCEGFNEQAGVIKPKFPVTSNNALRTAAIASSDNGRIIIVTTEAVAGDTDIYARRYDDSLGNKIGSDYMVNLNTNLTEWFPEVSPEVSVNNKSIAFVWPVVETKNISVRVVDWIFPQVRGDVNGDGKLAVADVIYLINYLFKGGPSPVVILGVGDVKGDGNVTVTDVIYLINYLFKGGPPPPPTALW